MKITENRTKLVAYKKKAYGYFKGDKRYIPVFKF